MTIVYLNTLSLGYAFLVRSLFRANELWLKWYSLRPPLPSQKNKNKNKKEWGGE
jgi:hypothetical protein